MRLVPRTLSWLLLLATFLVNGGSREKNPLQTEPIDEFALVSEIGDRYFSDYRTAGGLSVNTTIDMVYSILTDDDT